MPNAVTIDNYDIKIHERYAVDQSSYDPKFLSDANEIPTHFEIATTKAHLVTKWEELFEVHLHHHPFASFFPPPAYAMMRNRFFSHRLSPELDWSNCEEDEENPQKKQAEKYKKKIQAKQSREMPLALFEKDQTALLKLIDALHTISDFLKEINARRLQYQKG